jgi:hypothetical protein
MIKITLALTSLAVLLFNNSVAIAQSTFNDPVPVGGNAAQGAAGTATINSAIGNSGKTSKLSPAERMRRQAAIDRVSECKKEARLQYPAGDKRRYALTRQCQQNFETQKATWRK